MMMIGNVPYEVLYGIERGHCWPCVFEQMRLTQKGEISVRETMPETWVMGLDEETGYGFCAEHTAKAAEILKEKQL